MTATPLPSPTHLHYLKWGYNPTPLKTGTKIPRLTEWQSRLPETIEWYPGDGIGIVAGKQPDGTYLTPLDYDHKPEQGILAEEHYERFINAVSIPILGKIFVTRSTSGNGYHVWVRTPREIRKGWLRDANGQRIGDLLGTGAQIVAQPASKWVHGRPRLVESLTDDELNELLIIINYRPSHDGTPTDIDWSAVANVNVKSLIDARTLPRRIHSFCPGARVLLNQEPVRDTSHARYTVAYDLVRHEYTDTETAALLLHFCSYDTTERKGEQWLRKDISRTIGKCRKALPLAGESKPNPRQNSFVVDTNVGGRPRKQQLDEYLFWLQQRADCGKVLLTQRECASGIDVSARTIQRWEKELFARGEIRRVTLKLGNRLTSYIEFLPHDKTPAEIEKGGTIGGVENNPVDLDPVGHTCDSREDSSPVDERVPVAGLVAEAVEIYQELPRRRRLSAVAHYVHGNGRPDADPVWVSELQAQFYQANRRRFQDDKLVAKLRTLTDKQLTTKTKSLARKQADAHSRGSPRQAWVFGRMAWFVAQELERREPLRKMLGRGDPWRSRT